MTNRVHIDAPAGVVEIEGEKDFVEGLLAKVFPLLENAGFGSRPPVNLNSADVGDEKVDQADDDNISKPKTKRRKTSATPKGQSCAARITLLRQEEFFKQHRSTQEIVEGLALKGYTHNASQVSAALINMFGRSDIQRTRKDGAWRYYWDRE